MLTRLSVRNYAIISELSIEFSSRLNVITGETGAGKSIIAGAMGLILGQRADTAVLLDKEKKCVVEGVFRISANERAVADFLQENELDQQDELIVRREISASGKSRAFINDTPVNLSQLSRLSAYLVDLHQQFDTLDIGAADFQLQVLDALAGNAALLADYRKNFEKSRQVKKALEEMLAQKEQFEKEFDYHQFQFNEMEEAAFAPDEIESLEEELKTLSHADEIRNTLAQAQLALLESDAPIVNRLKTVVNDLQRYASYHSKLPELAERLNSAYIELQDIAAEIETLSDQVNTDPGRMELINERLSLGYRLLKKHGVKTTAELLAIRDELNEKLQAIFNIDDEIKALEKDFTKWETAARQLAERISAARQKAVPAFTEKVNRMLVQVGMPNARLRVQVDQTELNQQGMDAVEFLFNANAGRKDEATLERYQPVRKVASGGELSRLMLCIKSLVASSMDLPTLIFDEIDTGISGEAAKQVGIILKELAAARQIISITHQPQLAGKADTHFLVYKQVVNDAVHTAVKELTMDERIVAIAKMLSGEKPTAAAMENAREMVMN